MGQSQQLPVATLPASTTGHSTAALRYQAASPSDVSAAKSGSICNLPPAAQQSPMLSGQKGQDSSRLCTAGRWSFGRASARTCGLQDLPAEVVMHILTILPLREKLLAAQTSKWLHSAVMQPHFWPTHTASHSSPLMGQDQVNSRGHETPVTPGIAERLSTAQLSPRRPQHASCSAASPCGSFSRSAVPMLKASPRQASPTSPPGGSHGRSGSDTMGEGTAKAQVPSASTSAIAPSLLSDSKPSRLPSIVDAQDEDGDVSGRNRSLGASVGTAGSDSAEMARQTAGDWRCQGSLLGLATDFQNEHQGPTVLVAVVDPVTGQKGYAKQSAAQGLEPRWACTSSLSQSLPKASAVSASPQAFMAPVNSACSAEAILATGSLCHLELLVPRLAFGASSTMPCI